MYSAQRAQADTQVPYKVRIILHGERLTGGVFQNGLSCIDRLTTHDSFTRYKERAPVRANYIVKSNECDLELGADQNDE